MAALAHETDALFLTYAGMETDLIFTQGIDLPGFASYPLLATPDGQARLASYHHALIDLARQHGCHAILESPTWVANRDRGGAIGQTPDDLRQRNRQSVDLLAKVRQAHPDVPSVLSANIGPRSDAYAPAEQMTAQAATDYHAEQIGHFAGSQIDVISGYTIAYPNEAIGIVQAARQHDLPVCIAFTVETDGRLPTGVPLGQAIETVDAATDQAAAYFMINCAHPDHIGPALDGGAWMGRLRGIVANASRCSHAELDVAEALDDGDPSELGVQLARLRQAHPRLNVLGGCCGTDMRHMASIAQQATGR